MPSKLLLIELIARNEELEAERHRLWRWVDYLWTDERAGLLEITHRGEPPQENNIDEIDTGEHYE